MALGFSVPMDAYHSGELRKDTRHLEIVSTLLTTVGRAAEPATAGERGLEAQVASASLGERAVSSPQM